MNSHPILVLEPIYRWLDQVIAEHGLYLYVAVVWLAPFLIAWILNGGFWRRARRVRPRSIPLSTRKPAPPPLLPRGPSDTGIQSLSE